MENSQHHLLQKPGRYAGGEVNSVSKPGVAPAIALCFPDAYEIGMSHLGMKILYERVNADPRFAAERVFMPWKDRLAELRERRRPLTSLETKKPLHDFDLVGFSVSYELSYTNILEMLDLGGIPLHRRDRGENSPIVIAGGHCATHFAPMKTFVEGVFIGEADEGIVEMMEALLETRGRKREEKLAALAKVEGVLIHGSSLTARRRIFHGFESSPGVERPVVSTIESVQERAAIEITRGCTRGCRFCQAGYITRPVRYRSVELVSESVERALRATGYDEISLISLSACDHPAIRGIAERLAASLKPRKISISIPSTRVDAFDLSLNQLIGTGRKTGITLAPEVGNEKMDRVINKGTDPLKLHDSVRLAFENNWKSVKLYYLIGNPFENLEDVEAIGHQLAGLQPLARRHQAAIRAAVSVLCPKPWTPFQWEGLADAESLHEKRRRLREILPRGPVTLDLRDPLSAGVEAALARAGEEAGAAVEAAWRMGLILQSWGEFFNREGWATAWKEAGLDLAEAAHRKYGFEETLPWDGIEMGVEKEFLLREWRAAERASSGEEKFKTEDCATGRCAECGLPCGQTHPVVLSDSARDERVKHIEPQAKEVDIARGAILSFRFARTGPALVLGHLDIMRAFERALRRAEIRVAMSGGFSPRMKLRFPLALPLGIGAESEPGEIEIHGATAEDFPVRLNPALPAGLRIISAVERDKAESFLVTRTDYVIETSRPAEVLARIEGNLDLPSERKKGRGKTARTYVENLVSLDRGVAFSLRHTKDGSFSASTLLEWARQADPAAEAARTSVVMG